MQKIKAIISGAGLVAIVLLFSFLIVQDKKVKGAQSFWCLQKIIVQDKQSFFDYYTTETNLGHFFKTNNLIVYPEDKIALSLPLNVCKGSLIKIDRAPVINLKIGKNESIVRSWTSTVKDLLAEQKITLGAKDEVEPNLNVKVTNNMQVVLTHWGERTEKREEKIAFDTEEQPSADLVVGNSEVAFEGKVGKKIVTYKITSVNGDDISNEKMDEEIIEQPQNRIVLYGTKPKTTYLTQGQAKWYIDTDEMLAACNLVPRGTRLLITNLDNGKYVEVVASGGNNGFSYPVVVDLSTAAFSALGVSFWQGIIYNVKVEIIN